MADVAPVLNLSTTDFVRPQVVIDGESYSMLSPDECRAETLRELFAVGKKLQEIDKLADPDEMIDTLVSEVKRGIDLCMVDLPDEVYQRLSIMQQKTIYLRFFELLSDAKGESPVS